MSTIIVSAYVMCAKPVNKLWSEQVNKFSYTKALLSWISQHTVWRCHAVYMSSFDDMIVWSVVFILLYEKPTVLYIDQLYYDLQVLCWYSVVFFAISTVFLTLRFCAVMIYTKEL